MICGRGGGGGEGSSGAQAVPNMYSRLSGLTHLLTRTERTVLLAALHEAARLGSRAPRAAL